MASHRHATTTVRRESAGADPLDETEDVFNPGPVARATKSLPSAVNGSGPGESQFARSEVGGDTAISIEEELSESGSSDQDAEMRSPSGTESGEEFAEATPEQLAAAESGEETALSDLRGIEGFEVIEASEASEEGAARAQMPLREAGSAVSGDQQEFLPILAALAPTLISAIGPAVAKGVMSRLSPRARTLIKRLPRPPLPSGPIGSAVKGVLGAVGGAGGPGNMLGLVAKLLDSAQRAPSKPAGESGIDTTEMTALVEAAAAAIEVVIGNDDRVRVTQTTLVPWRRLCALRIEFPSGATYRGTGFLIGPRAVATAGHCVYLHDQGGWARKVEVIPGCNGSARPFGQAHSGSLRSVVGWVQGKKAESDYGCIVLPAGTFGGRNLGSFGFAAFDASALLAQPAVVSGYPGDKPFAEMWGMARKIKSVAAKTLVYDIDTMGGQSGAPVYVKRNGQRFVVGIHNYGATSGNSATRVTQPVYQRLLAWSQIQ